MGQGANPDSQLCTLIQCFMRFVKKEETRVLAYFARYPPKILAFLHLKYSANFGSKQVV
jgi:hypothetical protein